MPVLPKLFSKTEEEGTLTNSFYKARNKYPIPEPKILQGKYRPIFLMNMDAEILNKMLANQIQQHNKRIIHHDKLGVIPRAKTV